MSSECACSRCGLESVCSHGNWADRHPIAALTAGVITLLWTSIMLGVYPIAGLTIIAMIAVAAGVRMVDQKRRRRRALAARTDWENPAAMESGWPVAYSEEPSLPDAEEMRQTAWQPDVWTMQTPLYRPGPPAVRPQNPAPWHVVTQWPTRKFQRGTPPSK